MFDGLAKELPAGFLAMAVATTVTTAAAGAATAALASAARISSVRNWRKRTRPVLLAGHLDGNPLRPSRFHELLLLKKVPFEDGNSARCPSRVARGAGVSIPPSRV